MIITFELRVTIKLSCKEEKTNSLRGNRESENSVTQDGYLQIITITSRSSFQSKRN
jgi:hypothetical protein